MRICSTRCFISRRPSPLFSSNPLPSTKTTREKFSLMRAILGGVKFLFSEPIIFTLVLLDFIVVGFGYYRPAAADFCQRHSFRRTRGLWHALFRARYRRRPRHACVARFRRREEQRTTRAVVFSSCTRWRWEFSRSRHISGYRFYCLATLGLANSLQAVMRQTSFHLLTPDHVRGRAFLRFQYVFSRRQLRSAAQKSALWPRCSARRVRCCSAALSGAC